MSRKNPSVAETEQQGGEGLSDFPWDSGQVVGSSSSRAANSVLVPLPHVAATLCLRKSLNLVNFGEVNFVSHIQHFKK